MPPTRDELTLHEDGRAHVGGGGAPRAGGDDEGRPRIVSDDLAGGYEVGAKLGAGATAEAWAGVHRRTRTPVVLKAVEAPSQASLEALEREALALCRLSHPNILPLLDVGWMVLPGRDRPSYCLVSPFAAEGSLARLLEHGWQPNWWDVRECLSALLPALAHAHARGIYHCDVTPANILRMDASLRSRAIVLADFGIATWTSGPHGTPRDMGEGTPGFAAPEQGNGGPIGPWTDLYAVGRLAARLIRGHEHEHPPHLLDWIALVCLAAPADRPASAAEAWRMLDAGSPDTGMRTRAYDLPARWQDHAAPPLRPSIAEAESRLFAVRPPPQLGHAVARDAIWSGLREVAAGRPAAPIALRGGAVTHLLAEWAAHVAAETGAVVLRAAYDGVDRPALPAAVERWVEAAQRIGALDRLGIDKAAVHRLGEALWRSGAPFERGEREAMFRQLCERIVVGRPLVVVVEDLPAECVDHVWLTTALGVPGVLVVCTGVPPLSAGPAAPEWRGIDVGPLRDDELVAFAREVLDLDGPALELLRAHAGGDPLYVLQAVQHWVATQGLTIGRVGWTAAAGRALEPPDARKLGEQRVADLLAATREEDRPALFLAAVLGESFTPAEWAGAAARAGVAADQRVLRQAALTGVLHWKGGRWWFASAALATWLERRAPAVAALHDACVDVIPEAEPLRRVRHLEGAGRSHDLLEALPAAFERIVRRGSWGEAEALLSAGDAALERLGVRPSDERHARAQLRRARLLQERGDYLGASVIADAHVAADESGIGATAQRYLGMALIRERRYQNACAQLRAAEGAAERAGASNEAARAALHLGTALRRLQDAEGAALAFDRAHARFATHGDEHGLADVESEQANLLLKLGRPADRPRVEALLDRALSRYVALGRVSGIAFTATSLGSLHLARGNLAEATRCFRGAVDGYERLGKVEHLNVNLTNLCIALVLAEDTEGPRILDRLHSVRALGAELEGYVVLLDACVGVGPAATRALERALLAHPRGEDSPETALLLDFAAGRGREDVHVRASAAADAQWERLGGRPPPAGRRA